MEENSTLRSWEGVVRDGGGRTGEERWGRDKKVDRISNSISCLETKLWGRPQGNGPIFPHQPHTIWLDLEPRYWVQATPSHISIYLNHISCSSMEYYYQGKVRGMKLQDDTKCSESYLAPTYSLQHFNQSHVTCHMCRCTEIKKIEYSPVDSTLYWTKQFRRWYKNAWSMQTSNFNICILSYVK